MSHFLGGGSAQAAGWLPQADPGSLPALAPQHLVCTQQSAGSVGRPAGFMEEEAEGSFAEGHDSVLAPKSTRGAWCARCSDSSEYSPTPQREP